MGAAPCWFLCRLAWTWAAILAAITVAHFWPSFWVGALVVVFVATRQNVLGLLMHEQAHHRAFRSPGGDRLCNFTIAYLLLMTVEGYRRIHLAHHQHFFTDRDPDYRRKQGAAWTFPRPGRGLAKDFLTDLLGLNLLHVVRSKRPEESGPAARQQRFDGVRVVYYVVLLGFLLGTQTWQVFLLYWLVPLVTVLQVIVRWAAICEHKYNLVSPSVVDATPMIRLRWWESLVLPDLNFHTFHIYHHWYPAVPSHRLPCVHEIFCREGLVRKDLIFPSYGHYLRSLLK
jgi:fatty acid desaturase